MFFKRFKTLSLQKNITLILKSRTKNFQSAKVSSVGVIFDYDSYYDYDFFQELISELGVMKNKIRFVALIDPQIHQFQHYYTSLSGRNFPN